MCQFVEVGDNKMMPKYYYFFRFIHSYYGKQLQEGYRIYLSKELFDEYQVYMENKPFVVKQSYKSLSEAQKQLTSRVYDIDGGFITLVDEHFLWAIPSPLRRRRNEGKRPLINLSFETITLQSIFSYLKYFFIIFGIYCLFMIIVSFIVD